MTDSVTFAKEALRRTKVGRPPGAAFGPIGDDCLRPCFARDPQRITETIDRLRPLFD